MGDGYYNSEDENISDDIEVLEAFTSIVSLVQKLDYKDRQKLFKTLATFFDFQASSPQSNLITKLPLNIQESSSLFSEDRSLSPKEFLLEKDPITDIERITCLAYFLTHYREVKHFKTFDLSKLNTEAAQIKFSKAAKSVNNATTSGFLVQAGKGQKQISARGELYVQALPDHDAARASMSNRKKRKAKKRKKKTKL